MVPTGKGKILFDGISAEAICTDKLENFKEIEIYAKTIYRGAIKHIKLKPENNMNFDLIAGSFDGNYYIYHSTYKIDGNKIIPLLVPGITALMSYQLYGVNTINMSNENKFRILKVIGYKQKGV